MATLLQTLGSLIGLGDSEPLVSGNTVTSGTTNAAFHLDVHHSGAIGEQLLVAEQTGATIVAEPDNRAVILGGAGDDRLIGGNHADLLIGGGGINVMTGNGGTDTFGHSAGAIDVITDFSAAADEHIALQNGLTFTGATNTIVNPAGFGLTGSPTEAVTLTFSDNSEVVLLHSAETPNTSWFV